jgi:hypothetical protein
MIGVIAGDIIGSVHEHAMVKSADFPLFDALCRTVDQIRPHYLGCVLPTINT